MDKFRSGSHTPWVRHFTWGRCFHKPNRIEANFVKSLPDYPLHDHEFVEVAVVAGGTCVHRCNMGEQQFSAGDVFLLRPGVAHEYKHAKSLSLYNCCFDASLLGAELGWTVNDPLLGRLLWSLPLSPARRGTVSLRLGKTDLARAKKILDELCLLGRPDPAPYFGFQLGLLIQFLSILSCHLPEEKPLPAPPRIHPAVLTAIKMMEEDLSEQWTLPLLAERAGLRSDYFCRLFTEIVGLSPMKYLTRRRLETATNLLRRTPPLLIGEVGAAVGWSDANYFTRRFQNKFGISPSNYRARFMRMQHQTDEQSAKALVDLME